MGFMLVAVFALWSGSRSKASGKEKFAPSGELQGLKSDRSHDAQLRIRTGYDRFSG